MTIGRHLPLVLLVPLAVLTGCGPEFRSGHTVCAATEPRCPDGFVCGGPAGRPARCYRPGDLPDGSASTTSNDPADAGSGGRGGSAGTGGSGSGGTSGSGGNGMGGRGGSAGGVDGPAPSGMAVLKFCNTLTAAGGTPFEAELVVGNVRLRAQSRNCSPPVGQACTTVPSGDATITFQRVGGEPLATLRATIRPGAEHLVYASVEDTTNMVVVEAGVLRADVQCSALSYDSLFPAAGDGGVPPPRDAGPPPPRDASSPDLAAARDAGASPPPTAPDAAPPPPTGMAAIKFCAISSFEYELEYGGVTLRAEDDCTPLPPTACPNIPAGTRRLTIRDTELDDVVFDEMVTVAPGSNTVFVADEGLEFEDDFLTTTRLPSAAQCAAFEYDDID